MKLHASWLCGLLLLAGCDGGAESPAEGDTGGVALGAVDASPPVGGAVPVDAGTSSRDAALVLFDAGAWDARSPDALPPDALPPDALPPDAAPSPSARCGDLAGLEGPALVQALHRELSESYRPITPELDQGGSLNRYTTARFLMFQRVERGLTEAGPSALEGIYTGRTVEIGPDEEPDKTEINCEHTWPRARMDADHEGALYWHQQSDIHHLYPADAATNSHRGSLHFGEPVSGRDLDYLPAVSGRDANGDTVFLPREERRGDVARVVLYFSVRWGAGIGEPEESVLRAWSAADPPDERERTRNEAIAQIQGNRNPFIDCPELVSAVDDFVDFPILDRDLPLP